MAHRAHIAIAILLVAAVTCGPVPAGGGPASIAAQESATTAAREALVRHLENQGIRSERVLAAMRVVPRHEFVPRQQRDLAYIDEPLPIGYQQTISQPYVVALMTQLLDCQSGERVLEIGTGSGYQAAVLAELGCDVYSIEIIPELGERAASTLEQLGYAAHTRIGDGYLGWPEAAPFAGVIVTAAPEAIPAPLTEQLAPGGRMVIPVGPTGGVQQLLLLRKREDGGLDQEAVIPVRFVPMVRPR